jgi:hypothetical protein
MNSDIYEIQQLAIRYAHCADTFRFADQAGLFTEEGVWDARQVGLGIHKGRVALRDFWSSRTSVVAGAAHLVVNHLIDSVDGDVARGSLYIYSETRLKNGSLRFAGNLMHDVYQRTSEGWRFKSRELVALLAPRMDPPEAPPLTDKR